MLSHHYHDWGFTKSLKSAGQPPDLAEQLASRHLCAALAEPLLRHTEILWRQYAAKEDAAQVVPAPAIGIFFFNFSGHSLCSEHCSQLEHCVASVFSVSIIIQRFSSFFLLIYLFISR